MRNYKKEYANYQSKEDQKKRRAKRNKDRREAIKKHGKEKLKGKDVHHSDKGNLKKPKLRKSGSNRSDNRHIKGESQRR